MTKYVNKIFLLCILLISFMCICCNKEEENIIILDNTHPLALAPDIQWALVIDPYAAYRKGGNWKTELSGHCRKGDILQVEGKTIDEKMNVWYLFENGWLPESCLSIYSNRLKAESSANALNRSNN